MDVPLPWLIFAAVAAMGVGVFFFVHSRRSAARYRTFARRSAVTTGEILSLRAATDRDGDTVWFPTVRFDAPGRRLVTAEANTGSMPAPGKPGALVRVRFDLDDPDNFHLADAFAQPSTVHTLHGCLGIAFVLVGLAMLGFWALIVLVLEVPV